MRATLPLMLVVSLAVHGLLAGGVALTCWHGGMASKVTMSVDAKTTLTLIRPDPLPRQPTHQASALPKIADAQPIAKSEPLVASSATPPVPDVVPPMAGKATSVAALPPTPEANPNAHLPSCPSEAVLAPVPAPGLDGAKGVVFILDISGSMYEPYAGSTRLSYARQTLSRQVRALPDGTPFAIVLYAQRACPSGPLVAANEATREAAVRFLMRDVDCGGGTNLPVGLAAAEALRTGAIVLATDGDLNMPGFALTKQANAILGTQGHCAALSIVGVAPRAATPADQILQSLANQQGGSYREEPVADATALLDTGKPGAR